MAQLELRNVGKSYGQQQVVSHVGVTIERGEFFVMVGPSGCGKSTTLRMIAGLEEITSGDLIIDGKRMNGIPPSGRNISMVFQNYALYPHLTVKDNILFGLQVRRVVKKEQKKRLDHAAEMLGIGQLLNRKPKELSGGQRQRVALGRAIVSQHPICLMDEPLSNLDAKLRGQMRTEIRRLQQELGITMIYVTHDQVEAMTMGDRMMVMRDGEVQQIGHPLEVYNDPANLFVAQFMGAPPMNTVKGLVHDRGVEVILDGQRKMIPIRLAPCVDRGKSVILGIRPEALKPAPTSATGDEKWLVTVQSVELLGSETIVEFQVDDQRWKAKWNGQWNLRRGDEIHVQLKAEQMLLFDQESGKRLPFENTYTYIGEREQYA
ncbi:ABC transporter ATP-binding protein [Ammoniphilus sp. CFH 90114]|uniref:ABC transporter ATP-binding protein n=1 Tax=Ammoniphilus sp. CFH 90114 TaxID=2493665 RepID=UPI00100F72B7|nr:ABC transporter ATP-binding protein [Ammoniphilus sp. CFH 90114]RXT04303.1 ABC transporter ATP-binding protein [Ammoniphilus sp. CFH 90114]